MDQGSIGKLGNKVDETASKGTVTPDAGAPAASKAASAGAADTVELTSRARLLERLEKSLADQPAVDVARVAEVKAAIESGDYEINADAIADAMIRFEQSLGD